MKNFKKFIFGFLVASGGVALAATFSLFQPATGILKGNASTYITTAAVWADIQGLLTGSCTISTVVHGDGSCSAVTVPTAANPTASVGLSAVNGSAATFMRSDAAPPLSTTISPTLTGNWDFAATSGVPVVIAHPGATSAVTVNSATFAWAASQNAIDVGSGAAFVGDTSGNAALYSNIYFNGSNFVYKSSNTATLIGIENGTIAFQINTAPSGTAGANATLTAQWTVNNDGGMFATTLADEGQGTVNAKGLFINGSAVASSSGASHFNSANCPSGGGTPSQAYGVSSCTVNSTGNYSAIFSPAFVNTPVCTANITASGGGSQIVVVPSAGSVNVLTYATGGIATNLAFSVICSGA